jgi:hypothetical protein
MFKSMQGRIISVISVIAIFAAIQASAQRTRLITQVGFSDVGFNAWYETKGDLTATLLFPIGPVVSIGPFVTYGGNAQYFNTVDQPAPAKMMEVGGILRWQLFRSTKWEIYMQSAVSNLNVSYKDLDNPAPGYKTTDEATSFTIGAGTGFVYKITPSIYLNIFEFDLSFTNLSITDRREHKDFKTGLIIQFGKSK